MGFFENIGVPHVGDVKIDGDDVCIFDEQGEWHITFNPKNRYIKMVYTLVDLDKIDRWFGRTVLMRGTPFLYIYNGNEWVKILYDL